MKDNFQKQLKRFPLLIAAFIAFLVLMIISTSYQKVGGVVIFDAHIGEHFPARTYQRVEFHGNKFITGLVGQVFWKPKSFEEAFMLTFVVDDGVFVSAIDVLYLAILNFVLFSMTKKIKEDAFFSEGVLRILERFSIVIVLYLFVGLIKYKLADHYLFRMSKGELSAVYEKTSFLPYIIGSLFFKVIPIFIRKAQSIEKEQELTV